MTVNGDRSSRDAVLAGIRDSERFILVTHEHPDGDALGSLVAMHQILRALGKDSLMFMVAEELPLPREYRFFDLDGLVTSAARRRRRARGDLPGLRQHRPQSGQRAHARAAARSSTSTITTTTRCSAP